MKNKIQQLALAFIAIAFIIAPVAIFNACSTNAGKQVVTINSGIIGGVDIAMKAWAANVNAKVGSSTNWWVTYPSLNSQIIAVSNAYTGYYNAEMTLSNLASAYASEPTNASLATALTSAATAIGNSATNLENIVNLLNK